MPIFRLGLTGDLLDVDGHMDSASIGLDRLASVPYIQHHFLRDLGPSHDDPGYWERFYSLLITPRHIADAHGLYVVRPWIKASTFAEGAENLTVIGRAGAGYDKIDVQACTDNDVALFNAPDALTHSTASAALLLMLALAKRLLAQEKLARTGRWDLQMQAQGSEIQGRTLGIVGLGRSGRELARLVAPFDMHIIAYSPRADAAEAEKLGIKLASLEVVFREADFVSLHASLRPDTHSMIRREHLALMKPTAYLINVARGELLDQDALVELLQAGWIAGAGLDVFAEEPLPADHPLVKLDNVILTPHWLPATVDTGLAIGLSTLAGMQRAARGQIPEHVINTEVLERPGFRAKLARFEANARD
jgi:phosphoglycerate dehydrogenase-like enzyme